MKKSNRIMALVLVLALTIGMTMTTYAAEVAVEQPASENEAEVVLVLHNADGTVETIEDGNVLPRSSIRTVDLVSQSGNTGGNLNINFSSSSTHTNCVKLVMSLRYTDGHTGNVNVNVNGYTYTVPVDGVSRVVASRMTCFAGGGNVSVTGVTETMVYYIHLYAEYLAG